MPTPFEGDCLDAQFTLEHDQTLLCLSDGSPYEAGLHIYLLDAQDAVVDSILGASPYASGIFKIIECGDRWLNFEFFSNSVVYRMSVLEEPRFRFSLPTGWKYKHRLQTHRLTLTSLP